MLEVCNVTLSLNRRLILSGINLTVAPGELIGLTGINGSGKSTLLRAIAGLLPIDSGTIQLRGKALKTLSPNQRARTLAYLPQQPECHWALTAERVVALGRLPFQHQTDDPASVHIARALAAVDADPLRERLIHELSGGEKARVFLARALAGDPAFLLMDEPAAGLDAFHQLQLMDLLRELAHAEQRGILLVLHDLGLATRFCDRLMVLHQGRTLAFGKPTEVLTDALLAEVHGIKPFRASHEKAPVLVPWERIHDSKKGGVS